jgi:DNA-binding GntR family transcriptional regulator
MTHRAIVQQLNEEGPEVREPEDLRIRRTSTADQVADAIRKRILSGELTPGTALREVALANSMGVSRNTVREGIRALVGEGLVRHSIHRGVFVARLTEEDINDIFRVRAVIETAASQITPFPVAQLDQMERAAHELTEAIRADDFEAILDADIAFHLEMVEGFGSPRISAFHATVLSELRLGLFLLDSRDDTGRPADWLNHHREMLDLLKDGRTDECANVVRAHLAYTADRLAGRIQNGE